MSGMSPVATDWASADSAPAPFAPDDEEERAAFVKLTTQLKSEVARINQQISDFPLCNKSFNLSYCGHDL